MSYLIAVSNQFISAGAQYQIPAIEVGGFLSSIRSKIAFTKRGRLLIDEGYNKVRRRIFLSCRPLILFASINLVLFVSLSLKDNMLF